MTSSRRDFLRVLAASSALTATREFPCFDELVSASHIAKDPLRPQFHLLPARNWMNDPNGPIYWNGNYHMFLQYNPNAAVWGDMHWAHAVSPDMMHWKHMPVALAPTLGGPDQDGCFSGSAVLHEGMPTFLYTAVKSVAPADATLRDGTHNFRETQCLATSSEADLQTLHKLTEPVLLPPGDPLLTGFRDPCLWRDQDTWFMGVGSGQRGKGGQVLLYRSKDLQSWEYLHALTSGKSNGKTTPDFVDSGEMWECPDFFPLGNKFVLLYSTERQVFWQVGEFDRQRLVFHSEKQGLLDSGSYYAPKSQLDAAERRILWGWLPETRPESEFRAAGWAGCMSLPRVLALGSDNTLTMAFLPELAALRDKDFSLAPLTRAAADRRRALNNFALTDLACEIELQTPRRPFTLTAVSSSQSICSVSFDPAKTGAELQIAEKTLAIPATANGEHKFHLYLDASVVECLVDHSAALTTRVYSWPRGSVSFRISDQDLQWFSVLKIWEVKPISKDRLTS
jgi:beta-fructofuranosidase